MKIKRVYASAPTHNLVLLTDGHFAMVPPKTAPSKFRAREVRDHPLLGKLLVCVDVKKKVLDPDYYKEKYGS